jgi:cyanate lyase
MKWKEQPLDVKPNTKYAGQYAGPYGKWKERPLSGWDWLSADKGWPITNFTRGFGDSGIVIGSRYGENGSAGRYGGYGWGGYGDGYDQPQWMPRKYDRSFDRPFNNRVWNQYRKYDGMYYDRPRWSWNPSGARVYPQDMGVITQHMKENGIETGLWKDLPSKLEDIKLVSTPEGPAEHSWLLNTRAGVVFLMLMAKKQNDIKFSEIAKTIGRDEVWTTSAMFGNQSFDEKRARAVLELLGFKHKQCVDQMVKILQCPPMRMTCPVPDPTLKRIRELAELYSHPFKALIHEKLGDGVMSGVDCKATLKVRKNAYAPWERYDPKTGTTFVADSDPTSPVDGVDANGNPISNGVDVDRDPRAGDTTGPRICISFEGAFVPYKPW